MKTKKEILDWATQEEVFPGILIFAVCSLSFALFFIFGK